MINWPMVRAAGKRFAIARIGDGTYRDRYFTTNWPAIRAQGMIRGAYLYFEPNQDVRAQAEIVIAAVGRLGPGDLPVTLDVEKPGPGLPSPAMYTARIQQFVDLVTAGTGKRPMIYTGRYYWQDNVRSTAFARDPLWHAQYTTAMCPNIADQWMDWAFWQYTSSGRVAGIAGNVDLDRYNGTLAQLEAFAGMSAPVDAGPRDTGTRDTGPADTGPRPDARPMVDASADAAADLGADLPPETADDVAPAADVPEDPGAPADSAVPEDSDAGGAMGEVGLDPDAGDGAAVTDGGGAMGGAEPPGGCGCHVRGARHGAGALGALALACVRRRRRRQGVGATRS